MVYIWTTEAIDYYEGHLFNPCRTAAKKLDFI